MKKKELEEQLKEYKLGYYLFLGIVIVGLVGLFIYVVFTQGIFKYEKQQPNIEPQCVEWEDSGKGYSGLETSNLAHFIDDWYLLGLCDEVEMDDGYIKDGIILREPVYKCIQITELKTCTRYSTDINELKECECVEWDLESDVKPVYPEDSSYVDVKLCDKRTGECNRPACLVKNCTANWQERRE